MEKKDVNKVKDISARALRMMNNPWTIQHEPFEVIDDVYFVGTSWVSSFLIDTDEGLILIDCAMQETLYLLIDSIHRLGFDPRNISKLLLTHGHFDHCGAVRAIQEMSGCEVWIGKDDAYFFTERRDLIVFEDHVPEFRIDHYYDYSKPIKMGEISIMPVHCPGHTEGTTSLFFDIEKDDSVLTCGIHGGLGSYVMRKENLLKSNMPLSLQTTYLESIDAIVDKKVDVVLPSHVGHLVDHDFLGIAKSGDKRKFIDSSVWLRMLLSKKQEMLDIIEKEREA
ncbi:MBL fold metallo-hydrolase [Fusibacter ferrireducens]|uniref:MBL fold metallo-hydrolase n=1 Tax=Fusibacter ferrireducens TaxID=2785058 RepID=A0ABR9ZRR8_9FIRM|nr:MBL fold metallo-hydrolase [Fusibacter ferrireducens]MBF4693149.1 MBL fold metallo-hydrolase [Fusibacter ferrireducens]